MITQTYKADKLILKNALAGESFVTCPSANCSNAVEVAVKEHPSTGKLSKIRECVRCRACATMFCPKCGASPYHFNTECESIASIRSDYIEWMVRGRSAFLKQRAKLDCSFQVQLQQYEDDTNRDEEERKQLTLAGHQTAADEAYMVAHCKMCPSCGRIVEKTGGCDLMKCGNDYHGGNKQSGCGHGFIFSQAPAYQVQDVRPRQDESIMNWPQQMLHKWKLCEGVDLPCDACAAPIIGPKFTCIHCQSMIICATCEAVGPQALQSKLNPQFHGSHKTGHLFKLEMHPE